MDQRILFWINQDWANPWLDWVMAIASNWDFWLIPAISAGILVAIFGGFHARALLVCLGMALALNDGLIVNQAKKWAERPRPNSVEAGLRIPDLEKAQPRFLALGKPLRVQESHPQIFPQGGKSFPSGHASNNFCLATLVTVFYRRWGWLLFFPATLISVSRIYVASHWPSDVLISMLLGAACAFFTLAVAEWAWKRWGMRWLPKVAAAHPSLITR